MLQFFVGGAGAYNNIADELNRICLEIYGENTRSMTINDINKALGYTPKGMYESNNQTKTVSNLTTRLKELGDAWTTIVEYNTTNKSGIFYDPTNPNGISDNGATLGEYELNGYYYTPSDLSTIAQTSKDMILGSSSDNFAYWLASSGVFVNNQKVLFGPGNVKVGTAYSYYNMFISDNQVYVSRLRLRAIRTLTGDIPAAGEVLEFSGDYGQIPIV